MTRSPPTSLSRSRETEECVSAHLPQPGRRRPRAIAATPFGKIDFSLPERDTLVFVDVRYRVNSDDSAPPETVDTSQQARWHVPAGYYLQNKLQASKNACRFDIVALTGNSEAGKFR